MIFDVFLGRFWVGFGSAKGTFEVFGGFGAWFPLVREYQLYVRRRYRQHVAVRRC